MPKYPPDNSGRVSYPSGYFQPFHPDQTRTEGYRDESRSRSQPAYNTNGSRRTRLQEPLYAAGFDDDSNNQYFGGGRQNYAGVESGNDIPDFLDPHRNEAYDLDSESELQGNYQDRDNLWRSTRSYRGLGPKGYVRSDERIHDEICERLSADHWIDASDVNVTVKSGEVTLEGTIDDRTQKHRAEDIVDACGGVVEIRNLLSVSRRTGAQPGALSNAEGAAETNRSSRAEPFPRH